MTDRKPDFYCVREIILGSRRWLRIPVEHRSEVGPWSTKEVGKALQFDTHAEACVELDKLRQYTGGKYSPRIVPVYVKVTRKPKLHDFGWALKRMREGKRVRRAGQSTHYLCAKSYGGDLLPNCIRYNGPGGCGDVDDIATQDLTACDWQLYEAP